MKKQSVKAILSTLLILVFLCLASTGALLYFGRTGVILGVSRHILREVHFWSAVALCVLVPVHLILNMRIFKSELRTLRGKKADVEPVAPKDVGKSERGFEAEHGKGCNTCEEGG